MFEGTVSGSTDVGLVSLLRRLPPYVAALAAWGLRRGGFVENQDR